jgi:hypothetical protein
LAEFVVFTDKILAIYGFETQLPAINLQTFIATSDAVVSDGGVCKQLEVVLSV